MNHVYRLVWSRLQSAWVAVSETTRGMGKAASKSKLTAASLLLTTTLVQAAPLGGQVTAGSAQITQTGLVTNVTQQSNNASLSWQSFNVGATETVNFLQPSAMSIAVNRILDTNGSQIMGHLNANGQVYLINPNGILFGLGSQVNVGGLVASTLDVADSNLGSSTRTFSGAGIGTIVNKGSLVATPGGYISLLGNQVSNQGLIVAQLGTVALGGGSAATLTFNGNRLLNLQVDQSTLNNLAENKQLLQADGGRVIMTAGASDSLLASVVNNTGTVQAQTVWNQGGSITLLGGMAEGTVKVDGKIDASAPNGGDGGFIETSAKKVQVASTAVVTTTAPAGKTGNWLVDPYDFTVAATGGDITGAKLNLLLNSTSVTIDTTGFPNNPPTVVNTTGPTNPTYTGNWTASTGPGNIYINDTTAPLVWGKVAGSNTTLTLNAGNDVIINAPMTVGAVANTVAFNGLTINASRNILFNNIVTVAGQAAVALNDGLTVPGGNDIFNLAPTGFTGRLDITSKNASALKINGNVYFVLASVNAAGVGISNAGISNLSGVTPAYVALGSNVVVAQGGSTATNQALWRPFSAYSGIMDGLGHTLSQPAYTVNSLINSGCNGGQYCAGLFQTLNAGATIQNFGLIGGAVTTSLNGLFDLTGLTTTQLSYAGALVGDNQGTISNSYSTVAVIGNGVGGVGGLVGRNGGTIDHSFSTGAVTGTTPSLLNFAGGLVGNNHGYILNSYATGVVTETSQSTYASAGGLVGVNTGKLNGTEGYIYNSYATGAVNGTVSTSLTASPYVLNLLGFTFSGGMFGGLAGSNTGIIDTSYATGKVTGTTVTPATPLGAYRGYLSEGGLVGVNGNATSVCGASLVDVCGVINNSYSTSILAVGVNNNTIMSLGGLAGVNAGTIGGGSYASGNFSGTYTLPVAAMNNTAGLAGFDNLTNNNLTPLFQGAIGGLVGVNTDTGSISNASATSAITFTSATAANVVLVGGLAGYNSGLVDSSTANATITGLNSTSASVGGLVGLQFNAYDGVTHLNMAGISNSVANDTITVTGSNTLLGGLLGFNLGGTVTNSRTTGNVTLVDNFAGTTILDPVSGLALGELPYVGGAVGKNVSGFWGGTISGTTSAANVTATVTAKTYGIAEGGLVGMNQGLVTQSSATGIVKVTSAAAGTNGTLTSRAFTAVGGLAGINAGDITGGLSINNFNATSLTLTGLTNGIGGLVGYNGGMINHAMSTNTITASGKGIGLGGIAGVNDGFISDAGAYSTLTLATTALAANCTTLGACDNAVGGLVGVTGLFNLASPISISNSYAVTSITSSGYKVAVGGLLGASSILTTVADGYAIGKITTTNTNGWVGGLVGLNQGAVSTTYSSMAITGTGSTTLASLGAATGNWVGGLDGYNTPTGSVGTSYWNSTLFATGNGSGTNGTNIAATGLSSTQMLNRSSFVGFNFSNGFLVDYLGNPLQVDGVTPLTITGNLWAQLNLDSSITAPQTYLGAAATSGGTLPMLASEWSPTIWNAHQLQLMALAPTGNYTLGQDIDASNTAKGTGVDVWTGAGFISIGQGIYDGTSFTGNLNGNAKAIRNLMINATVDMTLINAIDANYNSGSSMGTSFGVGLFGRSYGTVSNLSMIGGSVTATNTEDMSGYLPDLPNNQGVVVVGSVAGVNKDTGTVKKVFTSTPVTGNGLVVVGGLTGNNAGAIKGSVSAGAVNANTNFVKNGVLNRSVDLIAAGGLTGANNGQIMGSYATGNVTALVGSGISFSQTGQAFVGGLVGLQKENNNALTGPSIAASFATGSVTATVTGAATPVVVGGLTTGYTYAPGLYTNLNVGGLVGQSGFASDIYTSYVGGSYATGQVKANGAAVDAPNTGTWPSGWVAMGGLVGYNYGTVSGSNAGGNFTAAVTGSYLGIGGLVGWNGSTGNVDSSYANIALTVTGNGNHLGGLVGLNMGSITGNSYSTGSITDTGTSIYLGGLAGSSFGGTISNSNANVALTFTDTNLLATTVINPVNNTATPVERDYAYVGGLVGYNSGGNISYSGSGGSIAAKVGANTNLDLGGLVGDNLGNHNPLTIDPFTGAPVTDTVTFTPIPAAYTSGVIANSYSTTQIKSTYSSTSTLASIGGLVGLNSGEVISSNAYGNFSGSYALYNTTSIGGLVGNNFKDGTVMYSSANTAFSFTGTALTTAKCSGTCIAAGGLVGNNDGFIEGSYANSVITAAGSNNSVGGLVGFMGFDAWYFGFAASGAVSKSYATTKIVSSGAGNNLGGLVGGTFIQPGGGVGGIFNTSYIRKSFATGTITSTDTASFVGGLIGKNTLALDPFINSLVYGSVYNPLSGYVFWNSDGVTKSYTMVTYTATGLGTKSGPLWGINTGTVSTNDLALPGI